MTIQKNARKTIATPPQKGGFLLTASCSGALWNTPLSPARRGSLSSVFIPAGRLGKDAPERGGKHGDEPMKMAVRRWVLAYTYSCTNATAQGRCGGESAGADMDV